MSNRYLRAATVRRIGVGRLIDIFLVSAVACILVIRAALAATGWPQLGNDTLHIAHMLWGGLGMLVALLLIFALSGRIPLLVAAFVGGLGFGAFIDELGKFITTDNNYFFEPTIGLIYIIFIILYLTARLLERRLRPSPTTYMANALDLTKESFVTGIDMEKRAQAQEYLTHCDQSDPAVTQLKGFFESLQTRAEDSETWLKRLLAKIRHYYYRLIRLPAVSWLVTAFAVVIALANGAWVIALTVGWTEPVANLQDLSFGQAGQIVGAIISGILAIAGVAVYWKSRLWAFRLFDYAVLVSIFITQIFRFWENELAAIAGLVVSIVLHLILDYAISRELQASSETDESQTEGARA